MGVAGRYRHAAMGVQELNFRPRIHVAERIEAMRRVFPSIAPEIIDISRRWVIPEYRRGAHPENRITQYPYVMANTEKIAKELWKDVRAGIISICDVEVEEDRGQVISHASFAVRKKIPDRTISADYRTISDLRQIDMGSYKEDCYPLEVVQPIDLAARIVRLARQLPTNPVLMPKRDISSAFRRTLLRPDLVKTSTADIPGEVPDRRSDVFF